MSTKRFDVYAPVIIPTLCRYDHFKRCIESLSRCTGAEYTELFIGLDYPLKKEHEDGYTQISDFISSISGFKDVKIFKRDKNFGVKQNVLDLKQQVAKEYDRFIYSEDDTEFAPNFLEYMNEGLTRYKDNPDVLFICGCTMPYFVDYEGYLKGYQFNSFPAKDYNAWGTGMWFSKMPYGCGLSKDIVLHSFKLSYKAFKFGYSQAIDRMIFQLEKTTQLNDVCRRLYCAFNEKYGIFPRVSKVRNWGFDGSGLNSDNNIKLNNVIELDTSSEFIMDEFEIKDYSEINSFIKKMYNGSALTRLKIMIEYVLFRITGKRIYISRN